MITRAIDKTSGILDHPHFSDISLDIDGCRYTAFLEMNHFITELLDKFRDAISDIEDFERGRSAGGHGEVKRGY